MDGEADAALQAGGRQALVADGKVRTTFSALSGGASMGLGFDDILAVISGLTPKDFYKSMTTHATIASGRTSTAPPLQLALSTSS